MTRRSRAREGRAVRLWAAGAGLLGLSVLTDSAVEHYRGSFRNRAMVLPLAASAAELAVATRRGFHPSHGGGRGWVGHGTAAAIGLIGLGFHLFNVGKRVGGVSWQNLFYGAPVGAPAALILASALGASADALGQGRRSLGPVALKSGRAVGALASLGLAGTAAEAGLLHFRGAYHNPAMWLPVTLPPLTALALARDAALERDSGSTRSLLAATVLLGFVGSGFHAYGVSRNMGGWANWRQSLLAGPPVPAPPAFTGLALAGLGALTLMRRKQDG